MRNASRSGPRSSARGRTERGRRERAASDPGAPHAALHGRFPPSAAGASFHHRTESNKPLSDRGGSAPTWTYRGRGGGRLGRRGKLPGCHGPGSQLQRDHESQYRPDDEGDGLRLDEPVHAPADGVVALHHHHAPLRRGEVPPEHGGSDERREHFEHDAEAQDPDEDAPHAAHPSRMWRFSPAPVSDAARPGSPMAPGGLTSLGAASMVRRFPWNPSPSASTRSRIRATSSKRTFPGPSSTARSAGIRPPSSTRAAPPTSARR